MNVKKRGAVQVNRALRGEVTFGFAVRGTKKGEGEGRSRGRPSGENKVECRENRGRKKLKTRQGGDGGWRKGACLLAS